MASVSFRVNSRGELRMGKSDGFKSDDSAMHFALETFTHADRHMPMKLALQEVEDISDDDALDEAFTK